MSIPRVGGGDPVAVPIGSRYSLCSPRRRGWSYKWRYHKV